MVRRLRIKLSLDGLRARCAIVTLAAQNLKTCEGIEPLLTSARKRCRSASTREVYASAVLTVLVRLTGVEPAWALARTGLSRRRIPFRHNRKFGIPERTRTSIVPQSRAYTVYKTVALPLCYGNVGASGRGRTATLLRASVFETDVSANSIHRRIILGCLLTRTPAGISFNVVLAARIELARSVLQTEMRPIHQTRNKSIHRDKRFKPDAFVTTGGQPMNSDGETPPGST